MKKLCTTLVVILAIVHFSYAQSFSLPGDGKWYRVATMGGMHANFQYLYTQTTPNNPSIASGEIDFINAQNAMMQHHQTMGYSSWNQPQFALINFGSSSEIWIKATNGTTGGTFNITKSFYATLNLGDISDSDLTNNGGVLTVYDKLADNSHIFDGNLIVPLNYVAIGSSNVDPNYKLSVKGNVHAQSVRVELANFPDYVFKAGYKLPSLTEVKTYIDQNHHLPEIPSETEVTKDGINLGEMVKLQTKKIEELTLYLIDKDKLDKEKDAKLLAQEARIDALEKAFSKLTASK